MNTKQRRIQGWLLVAYSLSILTTNVMDHGVWRRLLLSVAVCVLAAVVSLLVRARLRNGCDRPGDGVTAPPR